MVNIIYIPYLYYIYIYIYVCVCIIEHYLAIKNKILPFAKAWMNLEDIMLSEISQIKTDTV